MFELCNIVSDTLLYADGSIIIHNDQSWESRVQNQFSGLPVRVTAKMFNTLFFSPDLDVVI